MSADMMELKKILEQNIGDVYKNALASLGDPAAAMEVTRRVMALLKRTHGAGMSVTGETIKRLTDDCCREQSSYNSKKAAFRDGVIADMPDFDTAISAITKEEADAKGRSDAEDRAAEAYRAVWEVEEKISSAAATHKQPQAEPAPKPQTPPMPRTEAQAAPAEKQAARRRYTCVADIFEDFGDVIEDVMKEEPEERAEKELPAEPVKAPAAQAAASEPDKRQQEKTKRKSERDDFDISLMDDDDDDDYDDYDDDDYDDDDDDIEPLFEKKKKQPVLPMIFLCMLIAVLAAVAFCLAIMLMQRDVLPWGDSAFVKNFAEWFNSHLFLLF